MVIVGRHVNGITINPLEYLLGADGEVMEFVSEGAAKAFLKEKGFSEDELYWFVLETIPELNEKKDFMEACEGINKIEDLLTEAEGLFDRIPPVIQQAILDYHNEHGTIQHCLRYWTTGCQRNSCGLAHDCFGDIFRGKEMTVSC